MTDVAAPIVDDQLGWPSDDRCRAFGFATDVRTTMRNLKNPTITNKILLELSALVHEAMQCIEENTPLPASHLQQIEQFIPERASTRSYPETPLVKVSFGLIWLIEKLMNERCPQLPCTSKQEEQPSCPPTEAERPLFHHPQDIKVESVEVKEEPLDYDEEVKQEEGEEPLADVFCPSTGNILPLDPSEFAMDEEMMPMVCPPSRPNILTKRWAAGTPGPSGESRGMALDQPQKETVPIRACYLCHKLSGDLCTTPSSQRNRERLDFLKLIQAESPESRKRIHALRSNCEIAYFCVSHIARPAVEKTRRNLNRASSCDLCTQPRFPLSPSPSDAQERQRFFTHLIMNTPEQLKKIAWFVKNTQETAVICAKHFMKHTLYPGSINNDGASEASTIRPRAASACDLCALPKFPLLPSPPEPSYRAHFFTNLTSSTAGQKQKIDWFLKNPLETATICSKHFAKLPLDFSRQNMKEEPPIKKYLDKYVERKEEVRAAVRPARIIEAMKVQPGSTNIDDEVEPQAKKPRLSPKQRCELCNRCATVAFPVQAVPSTPYLRARFIANLIPHNEKDEQWLEELRSNPSLTPLICDRHSRKHQLNKYVNKYVDRKIEELQAANEASKNDLPENGGAKALFLPYTSEDPIKEETDEY